MARRPERPVDRGPLSAAELRAAISRFERRIVDLNAFDPQTVRDRTDARIAGLETSIDEDIASTFGHGTPTYIRYLPAVTLDRAPHNYIHPPDLGQVIHGLIRGKAESIELLTQLVRSLNEKLADLGAMPLVSTPEQ